MATGNSFPAVPSNYVTIRDLQERWMKRQQEELEKKQQQKLEPTLSQPQPRNHVRHGEERSSAAAIAPPSNRSGSAMAVTQADKSRVSEVEEQSALVAVEETGTTRASKSKRRMKKKTKKFRIDGKGKESLDADADADGGTEQAPAGKVAEESVSSTDLSKGGTFKVEVKCVSTESKAMQQLQPKINSPNCGWVRKVAGEGVEIEKKVSKNEKKVSKNDLCSVKIQNGGLGTETQKNANPANPTFKMEDEFEKLSMQDYRRGYRWGGRGGGRSGGCGRPSRGSEMVWVKKV